LIAAQVPGDARQLAGALNRLQAASQALGQPIDIALAESALSDIFRTTRRVVRLPDIENAVCDVFGIESKNLRSDRRSQAYSQPRMLAMWLARKYTRAAFSEIGEYFGRRSHSTVISARKKVDDWMASGTEIQMGYSSCSVSDAIHRVEVRLRTG
jgi:chromosomal replication initiator protein